MLEKLLTLFLGKKCAKCGARGELRRGYYNRAWNTLCQQAAGAYGDYCMKCRTIHYEEPDFDKWLKKEPAWIKPYPISRSSNQE